MCAYASKRDEPRGPYPYSTQVPGIHFTAKRGTRGTGEGQSKESSSGDGTGMGDRKKEVWKGLEKNNMAFDRLVYTMAYEAEIWGWKERKAMKRIKEKYLRRVMGVEGQTQGYMIRKELQREKIKDRAGKRA